VAGCGGGWVGGGRGVGGIWGRDALRRQWFGFGFAGAGLVVWLGICYYTVFLLYFNEIRWLMCQQIIGCCKTSLLQTDRILGAPIYIF
jgi:hypothetical protein